MNVVGFSVVFAVWQCHLFVHFYLFDAIYAAEK